MSRLGETRPQVCQWSGFQGHFLADGDTIMALPLRENEEKSLVASKQLGFSEMVPLR